MRFKTHDGKGDRKMGKKYPYKVALRALNNEKLIDQEGKIDGAHLRSLIKNKEKWVLQITKNDVPDLDIKLSQAERDEIEQKGFCNKTFDCYPVENTVKDWLTRKIEIEKLDELFNENQIKGILRNRKDNYGELNLKTFLGSAESFV